MKEHLFERKAELLEAALLEFTERTYEDASLNSIIKNAGISKGTFYYHFADKQALYLFLLERAAQAKWDFINEKAAANPAFFAEQGIFELFKQQAKLGAEFAREHPKYHALAQRLSGERERAAHIYSIAKEHLGGDTEDKMESMVDAALERGELRDIFPKEFLVKVLSYCLNGFDVIFSKQGDGDLDRMLENLDRYLEFIRKGMGNNQ